MRLSQRTIKAVHDGGHLTNAELLQATDYFHELADMLRALGPEWHIAWSAAWSEYMRLDGFRRARGL